MEKKTYFVLLFESVKRAFIFVLKEPLLRWIIWDFMNISRVIHPVFWCLQLQISFACQVYTFLEKW